MEILQAGPRKESWFYWGHWRSGKFTICLSYRRSPVPRFNAYDWTQWFVLIAQNRRFEESAGHTYPWDSWHKWV